MQQLARRGQVARGVLARVPGDLGLHGHALVRLRLGALFGHALHLELEFGAGAFEDADRAPVSLDLGAARLQDARLRPAKLVLDAGLAAGPGVLLGHEGARAHDLVEVSPRQAVEVHALLSREAHQLERPLCGGVGVAGASAAHRVLDELREQVGVVGLLAAEEEVEVLGVIGVQRGGGGEAP